MNFITETNLKELLKKQQSSIQELTQELMESNQGVIALTIELEQARAEYQNIFENNIMGIYQTEGQNQFKLVNHKMAEILGYDSTESLISDINDINTQIYIDSTKKEYFRNLLNSQGSVSNFESQIKDKMGNKKWISESTRLLKDNKGHFIGYEGVVQDITERKKIDQLKEKNFELQRLNEKLVISKKMYFEAFNRAEFYKDLFAHDTSNILQCLYTGLQTCAISYDDPNQLLQNIKIMENQVIRGSKLITNIHGLSKLEKSELILEKRDLCESLKDSITNLKKSEKDRKLNIHIHSVGNKLLVQANHFLEIVFDNILSNALNHNKNSEVEIWINISKENRKRINYVKIEFLDNGKGVKDDQKEKIFRRGLNGMGLGLSLVKKIIKLYNAEIWVEDRIKDDYTKGSNFIIIIPEVN